MTWIINIIFKILSIYHNIKSQTETMTLKSWKLHSIIFLRGSQKTLQNSSYPPRSYLKLNCTLTITMTERMCSAFPVVYIISMISYYDARWTNHITITSVSKFERALLSALLERLRAGKSSWV